MTEKPKCNAVIYKRDTYRYSGRGRGGFSLHYRRQQCSRVAVERGFCRQHAKTSQGENI